MRRIALVMGLVGGSLFVLPGAAQAGGFCQEPGSATEGEGTTVYMAKSCFTPTVLRAEQGDTIAFLNNDSEPHTVTAAGGAWGDAHREVVSGEVMEMRFEKNGVYPYTCLLHPGMTGTVVVGDGTGLGTNAQIVDVKPLSSYRPAARVVERGPSPATTIGITFAIASVAASLGFALGRRRRELRPIPVKTAAP